MYYYYKNSTDTVPMLLLLLFSLTVTLQFQAKTVALPNSSCPKSCSDVDIIYPFGVGAGCAMEGFELNCNLTEDGCSIVTFFGVIPVLNISLLHGQYALGCVSQCSPYNNTAQDGLCAGAGCCQVQLSSNMHDGVHFNEKYNTTRFYTNRSTTGSAEYWGYAVMLETAAFRFKTTYLNTTAFLNEHAGRVPAILNWAVGTETCDVARKKNNSYACLSPNSVCVDSSNGPGYLCNCTEGYQGNPYLHFGCQDTDECAVNKLHALAAGTHLEVSLAHVQDP